MMDTINDTAHEDSGDQSWRVQLFWAARDGNLDFVRDLVPTHPHAIHDQFCEGLSDWMLEWESLKWYEFGEATCLYIASSYCQEGVVRWLLENGVDRDKSCYHGQKPLDVVGQCRLDAKAEAAIRQALCEKLQRPRAPIAPSCIAKLGYQETVRKVYETVSAGKGVTKRVPKRVVESVATCKATVSWQCYWLSDITSSRDGTLGGGVTYELQYRSKIMQDWVVVPTKTPNKILTGLSPGHLYSFRVRAVNSEGWGAFSSDTEVQMPSVNGEREKEGAVPAEDESEESMA